MPLFQSQTNLGCEMSDIYQLNDLDGWTFFKLTRLSLPLAMLIIAVT